MQDATSFAVFATVSRYVDRQLVQEPRATFRVSICIILFPTAEALVCRCDELKQMVIHAMLAMAAGATF